MASLNLYEGNNSLDIELSGLKLRSDGSYLNGATVTCDIEDVNGDRISGTPLPLTLSYETGSNGNYSAVLDSASDLVAGRVYTVRILAISGSNKGEWTFQTVAKTRPFY